MANADVTVQLNTAAPLDTANPPTARPAGVLIEAQNLGSRWWGPRTPNRADGWYGQLETTGSQQALFMEYDGTSSQSIGRTKSAGIKDLGTTWTLDLWAGLKDTAEDLAYANTYPKIPVFVWGLGPVSIYVWITSPLGVTGGNPLGSINVQVKTSDRDGNVLHTYDLLSNVVMPVNTGGWSTNYNKIKHIRVVRNGPDLVLYVDGVLADSETVAEDEAHFSAASAGATWLLGFKSGDGYFKGLIPAAVLRDGAHTGTFDSNLIPQNPWSKDVRLHVGCVYSGKSGDVLVDASRSRMHGRHFPTTATANPCVVPSGAPIQGIGNFVTRSGKPVTAVMVGGKLVRGYV